MGLKVGLDFGTSNSGVGISDGTHLRVLPLDKQSALPEVVKTILYITREYQHFIGQEAIELYYKHNVNRVRRYEMQWAGAIQVLASEVDYMHDVFVEVDVLKPGSFRSVFVSFDKVGPGPIQGRHEIITDRTDIFPAKVHKRLPEIVNVLPVIACTGFDI